MGFIEYRTSSDAAIQCELLLDDLHGPTREFDITDVGRRRRFVRCLYGLLMLQIAMIIPCLEICIHYAHILIELPLRLAYFVFIILLYTWLYIYRDWRRRAPFNYLIYLLTSIAMPISTSIHLIYIDQTRWLHAYPLMIIVELLVLVLYTTQQRFKFSHAIGVLIIYSVYGLILLSVYIFFIQGFFRILYFYKVTFEAWYIIYDTRQMLCGDHGYNLQPDEYIYAAANIHADLPKFLWLHAYPLMIIIELIVLVLYTTQQRIKFSHAIGILIILLVYGLIVLLSYFIYVNCFFRMLSFYGVTFEAWYIIYDTHLMLCGVHGYNLQPDEHMYAAGNIHADLPKFLWIIIGHFVLGPVRGFIKALRHSRTNYIC
ncbi:uncharacterized protein LOC117571309 [Drosophila albomicans]|uniref:Uncharacterized protein LOC117571309 n=1 Tax=Drosophila albomicans TaxID=7291 RepID=A0A9C6T4A3_DROAB|nr:uncharacterized protein LOC117571309 [Drosophila albomicans]